MTLQIILLTLFWVIFYGLHSLLASNTVKDFVKQRSPKLYRFYRLLYNLIAFVSLALVLFYQFSIPSKMLSPLPYWVSYGAYGFLFFWSCCDVHCIKGL